MMISCLNGQQQQQLQLMCRRIVVDYCRRFCLISHSGHYSHQQLAVRRVLSASLLLTAPSSPASCGPLVRNNITRNDELGGMRRTFTAVVAEFPLRGQQRIINKASTTTAPTRGGGGGGHRGGAAGDEFLFLCKKHHQPSTSMMMMDTVLRIHPQYHHQLYRHFSDWGNQRGYDLTHDLLSSSASDDNGSTSGRTIIPPKVVLEGYGPTGFDVLNMIRKVDTEQLTTMTKAATTATTTTSSSSSLTAATNESGLVHMNGSILVFPNACFLWKPQYYYNNQNNNDITNTTMMSNTSVNNKDHAEQQYQQQSEQPLVSLQNLELPIVLHRPKLEYFFVGCDPMDLISIHEMQRFYEQIMKKINQSSINSTTGSNRIVMDRLSIANAMGTFNILNAEDRVVSVALLLPPRNIK